MNKNKIHPAKGELSESAPAKTATAICCFFLICF